MPTIILKNVSKRYVLKRNILFPKHSQSEIGVQDIDLTIRQGEFVSVIGSSGAGKSTLLNLIAGQIKPNSGTVTINGKRISHKKRWQERKLPLLIGYVSQTHMLNRSIKVEENLRIAARAGQKRFDDKNNCKDRVQKVLGLTGLAGKESKYPGELTAGECRRVELARALINSPPILVLDEVMANLDADSMWDVFLLLYEINQRGTTIIMATHNSDFVNMIHRRVITLVDGRIYSDQDKARFGEIRREKPAMDPKLQMLKQAK